MFIGHFAVGFGAKKVAPEVSLGTWFLACQLADLVWPVLVLLGIERVVIQPGITVVTPLDFAYYPFSHSLIAMAGLGVALALTYRFVQQGRLRASLALFAVVLSHWLLDVLSHRPDMPILLDGGPHLGLGLWGSLGATLVVELGLLAGGLALYLRSTEAKSRKGNVLLGSLVAFLGLIYLGNLFGPPPPSAEAVAWSGIAMWLLVAWGYWVDRHRQARHPH